MEERQLRALVQGVKTGHVSRRDFIQKMLAVGLSVPMAGTILSHAGAALAQEEFVYKPQKAGGGGTLRLLQWQAATQLNPHFATGSGDQHAVNVFYEPLASWDMNGRLTAILAAELPTLENGGVSADGTSVTWKLKQGVKWHDGTPFTADDCIFTAAYAADPATSAWTLATYKNLTVEKIDDHTIKITFAKPTPFWADPFVGSRGFVLPKHVFEPFKGANARQAPVNLKPVGTGPYVFSDFRPGDMLAGKANPEYHVANRPYFDAIEIKGGGDATSAARAVLQTGEYDFAWNLSVEDDVLKRLASGGKGDVTLIPGANIEHIQLNRSDPWTEVDGEKSSPKSDHPIFSDKAVRDAIALLVDRKSVAEFIYGRSGVPTGNFINMPEQFVSKDTSWAFDLEKANALLDGAGWIKGANGIREKDGRPLRLVYQSTTNSSRQKTQVIVKQACAQAGIELELKSVPDAVFFSSDPGNPDTFGRFSADMQMYTSPMREPDPGLFMQQFVSSQASSKANNWQGRNVTRWRNKEFDELHAASTTELDPVKRAALFIQMNNLVVNDGVVVPVVFRQVAAGARKGLKAPLSTWTSYLWRISDWYLEA